MVIESDIEKKAREFRERHGISSEQQKATSDHPFVEFARLLFGNAELLADDRNEAFSQLDKGKFRNLFTDETLSFALAYTFATHPMDDIEKELQLMGLTVKEKINEKVIKDGVESEITKIIDVPITFEITPLKIFIEEWVRRRHAVNRLRVKEFINLVTGQGVKDFLRPQQTQTNIQEPQPRGRII